MPVPRAVDRNQEIERRDVPAPGFGVPTASGTAGTATPGATPARPDSQQESRATPEAATDQTRHQPVVRQTPPAPRRTDRAEPPPPPRFTVPAPSDGTLPPTTGFGDLPRPPGLVGAR